jgi:hypothetical protein
MSSVFRNFELGLNRNWNRTKSKDQRLGLQRSTARFLTRQLRSPGSSPNKPYKLSDYGAGGQKMANFPPRCF